MEVNNYVPLAMDAKGKGPEEPSQDDTEYAEIASF